MLAMGRVDAFAAPLGNARSLRRRRRDGVDVKRHGDLAVLDIAAGQISGAHRCNRNLRIDAAVRQIGGLSARASGLSKHLLSEVRRVRRYRRGACRREFRRFRQESCAWLQSALLSLWGPGGVEHGGARRSPSCSGSCVSGPSVGQGRTGRACRRHRNSQANPHVRLAGHQGRRRRLSGGADRPHHHPLHGWRRRGRRFSRRRAGYRQYRLASPRLRHASRRRDRLRRRRGLRRGGCHRRHDGPQGRGRAWRGP